MQVIGTGSELSREVRSVAEGPEGAKEGRNTWEVAGYEVGGDYAAAGRDGSGFGGGI